MNFQSECVFVLHIPKTAGTTLRGIIGKQYAAKQIIGMGSNVQEGEMRFRGLNKQKMKQISAVFGHFSYGLHTALPDDRKYTYVTLLRDPVQRALSEWSYIRSAASHYLTRVANQLGLVQFVCSGVTCTLDNGMVRQLCGDNGFSRPVPHKDMRIPFGHVNASHLETAKENIRHDFAIVGTAESFEESLELMCRMFGWQVEDYENRNVSTSGTVELTEKTVDAVVARNELDYELYHWADDRLEQIIDAQGI